MNLTLIRKEKSEHGIFGEIPELRLCTLEHAYPGKYAVDDCPYWEAKIPNGTWKCVRGFHRLHMETPQFETFEIMIPGHTGILFHSGNTNANSSGCVLLGCGRKGDEITDSRIAFKEFMDALQGVQEFPLTVRD